MLVRRPALVVGTVGPVHPVALGDEDRGSLQSQPLPAQLDGRPQGGVGIGAGDEAVGDLDHGSQTPREHLMPGIGMPAGGHVLETQQDAFHLAGIILHGEEEAIPVPRGALDPARRREGDRDLVARLAGVEHPPHRLAVWFLGVEVEVAPPQNLGGAPSVRLGIGLVHQHQPTAAVQVGNGERK